MDGTTNKHKWPEKVAEKQGMPFRVIKLRDRGRRISRQEMIDADPLVGLLVFDRVGAGACVRYHSSASLLRSVGGVETNVCRPLFDPTMEGLDAGGLILRGYENETVGGDLVQYIQVWLCKPILEGSIAPDA
jgi:hypothetical protein